MDILKELWLGQIAPAGRPLLPNSAYYKLQRKASEMESQLSSTLNPEQKSLLESCFDAEMQMQDIAEIEAFSLGFRLGVQLLLAATEKCQ